MTYLRSFFSFLFIFPVFSAASGEACDEVRNRIAEISEDDAQRMTIVGAFIQAVERSKLEGTEKIYCRAVSDNLVSKQNSLREGVRFTTEQLLATAIAFEEFRIESYLKSGVSPKRYFGFLDQQGRTAKYERELREVVPQLVRSLNVEAAARGFAFRITDKEVVVTFLSEGGSLLLTDEFRTVDRVHPVRHVGLDDYRVGFVHYPGLLEKLDREFGTRLGMLSLSIGKRSMLIRPMTFREAIIGTAVMYLYEKEIAANLRTKAGRKPLHELSIDDQFIITSLVYNSGLLFSDDRVDQIRTRSTRQYLLNVNQLNARRKVQLPIPSEALLESQKAAGSAIPRQLTSWNAVYHILQRFGAWEGLTRYSRYFSETGALLQ